MMPDDAGWMATPVICQHCGKDWVAVHPCCEWLQCEECLGWTQIPSAERGEDESNNRL
jgi:hypothetical protein